MHNGNGKADVCQVPLSGLSQERKKVIFCEKAFIRGNQREGGGEGEFYPLNNCLLTTLSMYFLL